MKFKKRDLKNGCIAIGYTWIEHPKSFATVYFHCLDSGYYMLSYSKCKAIFVNPARFFQPDILDYCDADNSEMLNVLRSYSFIDAESLVEFEQAARDEMRKQKRHRRKFMTAVNFILQKISNGSLELRQQKITLCGMEIDVDNINPNHFKCIK